MTHSIFVNFFFIVIAALFAAAILWGEHYHPWGRKLDPRLNYVLGTLAMMIPYSFLLVIWMLLPPPGKFGAWALFGVWFVITVSGGLVHLLYEMDEKRESRQRAMAAEKAEQAART